MEADVQAEIEAKVEADAQAKVEADVQAKEDDDDNNDFSEFSDSDFEENWDWTTSLDLKTFTQTDPFTYQSNEANLHGHDTSTATNPNFVDEDGHSDELDTPPGSDIEVNVKVRFPWSKVSVNDEDVKFEVGMQFSNKKEILKAIKTFVIVSKKKLRSYVEKWKKLKVQPDIGINT